jgi:uncharacterized BrkB/YihY/UPF0761 family membrane protein
MLRSLLSAVIGLIAGAGALTLAFAPVEAGSDINGWIFEFQVCVLFGLPVVMTVWLFVLWPLYMLVPKNSVLWRPVICIVSGGIAGATLLFALIHLFLPRGTEVTLRHLLAGATIGAVTCAAGSNFKRREASRADLTKRCSQPLPVE